MSDTRKRVFILCEGQTEETFCNELLKEHFFHCNIDIIPHLLSTSSGHKGGLPVYSKVKKQIKSHKMGDNFYVTTFFDYYGLRDFPGINDLSKFPNGLDKCLFLEQELAKDINRRNFIPNIILHEFEALLYSDLEAFENYFSEDELLNLRASVKHFSNPEAINDSPSTAPSKRILKCKEDYDKVLEGPLIALDIGLSKIRGKCSHFNSWIKKLEQL